ncbi:hypothetical protein [Streptomyces sp. c-19]|uniref:hypothetical protein n=1 Tax=Streptomyces sp. c-19 TaxID=2789275 RepID=UPI003980F883
MAVSSRPARGPATTRPRGFHPFATAGACPAGHVPGPPGHSHGDEARRQAYGGTEAKGRGHDPVHPVARGGPVPGGTHRDADRPPPREAVRPVPPVHQSEVATRAVLRAARHPRRREYRVGAATAAAALAHRAAPGLLARTYDARQTDVASATAPHNLWPPLDGAGGRDHGAHGPFDDEAAAHSAYTALDRHPAAVRAAVGTAAFVARVLLGRPGAARRPRAEGR